MLPKWAHTFARFAQAGTASLRPPERHPVKMCPASRDPAQGASHF